MQNVMEVMDRTGHTTTQWNPNNPDEVAVAEATFKAMTAKGYRAFKVDTVEQRGGIMREFDPAVAKMILVPHMQGG